MREVRCNALVPHTPAQMYALVNDVARYPDFVPWCAATEVHAATAESMSATLHVARFALRFALTTLNTLQADKRIDMALVAGPLRSFRGSWLFLPIHAAARSATEAPPLRGCRVELQVDFEFKSGALGLVAGPVFEAGWGSLVDAFVRRAREIYGG
jgi:ribosome-associated toxin RatA of RatAB toxin-antitoxin module